MLLAFSIFHGILENIVYDFMHFLGYLKAFYADSTDFFYGNYNLYKILQTHQIFDSFQFLTEISHENRKISHENREISLKENILTEVANG